MYQSRQLGYYEAQGYQLIHINDVDSEAFLTMLVVSEDVPKANILEGNRSNRLLHGLKLNF